MKFEQRKQSPGWFLSSPTEIRNWALVVCQDLRARRETIDRLQSVPTTDALALKRLGWAHLQQIGYAGGMVDALHRTGQISDALADELHHQLDRAMTNKTTEFRQ